MGDICMPLKFGQNLKNVDFWVSFTMVTVFFGPNQLVLVQIIKARYRAAMLESEPGYSGLVRGCYVRTGTRGTYWHWQTLCWRPQLQPSQFFSGPVPGRWYYAYILKCFLVPISAGFAVRSLNYFFFFFFWGGYQKIWILEFFKKFSKICQWRFKKCQDLFRQFISCKKS